MAAEAPATPVAEQRRRRLDEPGRHGDADRGGPRHARVQKRGCGGEPFREFCGGDCDRDGESEIGPSGREGDADREALWDVVDRPRAEQQEGAGSCALTAGALRSARARGGSRCREIAIVPAPAAKPARTSSSDPRSSAGTRRLNIEAASMIPPVKPSSVANNRSLGCGIASTRARHPVASPGRISPASTVASTTASSRTHPDALPPSVAKRMPGYSVAAAGAFTLNWRSCVPSSENETGLRPAHGCGRGIAGDLVGEGMHRDSRRMALDTVSQLVRTMSVEHSAR